MKKQSSPFALITLFILVLLVAVLSSCQGKSLAHSSHYSKCVKNGADGCAWHK